MSIKQDEDHESIFSSINLFLSNSQRDYENKYCSIPLIAILIVIVIKCGVICSALILIILRCTQGEADFKPEWERFSLEIVAEKRNFTQTVESCSKNGKSDAVSMLAFFYSQKEEDFMEHLLTELMMDEKVLKKFDFCRYRFYVGMRKSVGEEWMTADGNFVFGSDFMPSLYETKRNLNNEFCTALSVRHELSVVQLQCENNANWNCFICEHPCKSNESQNCFDLWNDKEVTNRTDAIEYCQMADVPGELIALSSTKLLNKLRAELMDDIRVKNCSQHIAISNLFTLRYESVYEEPMSFVSTRFNINANTDINKHCLLLDLKSFKWIFTGCEESHCYICKILEGVQELPEYPTDSIGNN